MKINIIRTMGSVGQGTWDAQLPAARLEIDRLRVRLAAGSALFSEMPELAHILAEYGPSLGRVVAAYAGSNADREDLAQEIALALVRALPRYRGESSLRTYVLRIAHNCGVRHSSRRPAPGQLLDEAQHRVSSPNPEQAALAQQHIEQLAEELRRLPLGMRQVLSLTLEGLSQSEIAEVLALSENVVSVRLHRARKMLRERLST
ncbi:MAG TPA: sigma-70 family RNA polymerase sigma factor [Polyangiales bacterium]|nr:sigma-70 family RNA polymerase sigma factor [Polyangiales bacterium]